MGGNISHTIVITPTIVIITPAIAEITASMAPPIAEKMDPWKSRRLDSVLPRIVRRSAHHD
jgi:hypothetical protein